ARSGVCGIATTLGCASATASVLALETAGSVSADVVTGVATLLSVGVRPNSCRAAAITIHGSGDSTGAVGALPENGLRNPLTTLDTATVATVTGSLALTVDVAGDCSFGFSTVTLTVGARPSATLGSSTFLVDSVAFACTVRAVALPVSRVGSTASWVVGCCAVLDFFFFFGFGSATAVFVSLESVDASAFSSARCLLSDDDVPEVASDDDSDPDGL